MRTRGCSGLTYTLDYASEKKKMDEEVNQDGKGRKQTSYTILTPKKIIIIIVFCVIINMSTCI